MLNYYFSNMETRKCSKCGEVKPINEFYKHKKQKDGLSIQCKCCVKEYYKKHLKERREYQREYRKEHREYINKYNKEDIVLLKSWYIKSKLISLGWEKEDITEEIIETKRNIIKTKRLIKLSF